MAVDNGQTSVTNEMYNITQGWFKLFLVHKKMNILDPLYAESETKHLGSAM